MVGSRVDKRLNKDGIATEIICLHFRWLIVVVITLCVVILWHSAGIPKFKNAAVNPTNYFYFFIPARN